MPKSIIESVLSGKLSVDLLLKWLDTDPDEDTPEDCDWFHCSRSEFVAYFIAYLRIQTDSILKPKGSGNQTQTPETMFPPRSHKRSTSEPTSQQDLDTPLKTDRHRSHESPNRERNHSNHAKKSGRRVKTKLFMNESKEMTTQSFSNPKTDSDDSKISSNSHDISAVSSTPLKNSAKVTDYPNLNDTSPVTPQGSQRQSFSYDRCDTPRIGHRYKAQEKCVSLGDYIVNAHVAKTSAQKKKRQSKNVSNDSDGVLDLSSADMFPKIGDKKSTDKKRIKPTNVDRTTPKSFTMNSFNADQFQQPSPMASEDNIAFRHQNIQPKELAKSFDVERNILKQERHKLMEKFNILNVGTTPKVTSQIKVTQKISTDKQPSFVKADINKVVYKNEIDTLINIYNVITVNNLILSVGCEIFFLINILLSKQTEEDYVQIEKLLIADNNLKSDEELSSESALKKSNNIDKYLLKSIHNCVYFAVKSLWHLRYSLEVIFDKSTLKLLGDNKDVRGFLPELAKFLLNAYGVKCEQDASNLSQGREEKSSLLDSRSGGMVCFNVETDNVENFPSVLSFQNFRKQRDMFYEILRWYNETQQTGPAKSTFRSRVKTILSVCVCAANYAHLARLYVAHMLAECIPHRREDTKLCKLQRRLTGATQHSYRLPFFTEKEMFYKEFLLFAEHDAFRAHLRDCITSEIYLMDSTALTNIEESTPDIAKEYLYSAKKLQLLSKFLGFLSDLPYTQVPIDYNLKTGHCDFAQREISYPLPKERVLLNEISIRNNNQPTINLKGILTDATDKERLCISLPWITQYLATLHYATLRIQYYRDILNILFRIYTDRLKENSKKKLNKTIMILLRFQLGWLFNLPQFPQEMFYEKKNKCFKMAAGSLTEDSVGLRLDSVLGIDESAILELCPFLRDISILLSSTRPIVESKDCTYRHITPLSLTLNYDEKIKNKEREIQLRLEEALIKSSPASTRRVLEVVIERVSASCLKALATLLRDARGRRADVRRGLPNANQNKADLHAALTQLYTGQLESLRKEGLAVAQDRISGAVKGALSALLTLTPKQSESLEAIAIRHCRENITKWINNNWNSIEILCKDINEEVRNIVTLGCSYIQGVTPGGGVNVSALRADDGSFEEANVQPSLTIIGIKEYISILLDNEEPTVDIYKMLSDCLSVCSTTNVFSLPGLNSVICQLVCDLCVVLASQKPNQISDKFLNKIYEIFHLCCPERYKSDSAHKSTDKSIDLNNTADISVDVNERNDCYGNTTDPCEFDRDFSQDDRVPTPISDDDDNSTKTVTKNELTSVKSDRNVSIQDLPSKSSETIDKYKFNSMQNEILQQESTFNVIASESGINISDFCEASSSKCVVENVEQKSAILNNNLHLDLNNLSSRRQNISENNVNSYSITNAKLEKKLTDSDVKTSDGDSKMTHLNTKITDLDSKTSDIQSKIRESSKATDFDRITETDTKITESDTKITESDTKITESDTKITEPDTKITESDTKITEPDTKMADSKPTLNESTRIDDSETTLDYFNRILCSRNIVILSRSRNKPTEVWNAMADILIFLLKSGFLNEESLTEQCLAAYRQDWPENVLEHLSTCMKLVSTKWPTRFRGKFNLFLDFLSEYCNTMEFDRFEIS